MCAKLPYCNPRIDGCLKKTVKRLNKCSNFKTLACCCGHGAYSPTIIIKDKKGRVFEFFSRKELDIRNGNRYYKKDINGFYYIPAQEIRE